MPQADVRQGKHKHLTVCDYYFWAIILISLIIMTLYSHQEISNLQAVESCRKTGDTAPSVARTELEKPNLVLWKGRKYLSRLELKPHISGDNLVR